MHAFMQKPLSRPVNVYVSSNQASLDKFLFISDIIPNLCGDPGAARQLCLRIHLQASLGGRLGRFVIVSMVQVRHIPVVYLHVTRLVACELPRPLPLPAAEIFPKLL